MVWEVTVATQAEMQLAQDDWIIRSMLISWKCKATLFRKGVAKIKIVSNM